MAEAALLGGCRYDLSSQGNNSGHKSYLFVKLTDSALRALTEHSQSGGRHSISFRCNEGSIRLSNGQRFEFGMSTAVEAAKEQQASHECLRQVDSSRLELLGSLDYRLRVQANDDVYETTRQRMADVEQASKLSCTRVLKPSDNLVSRRVKNRPLPPSTGRSSSGGAANGGGRRVVAPPHHPPPPPPPPPRPPPTRTAPTSQITPASQTALIKRPLRERISHILAVRSCKRVEVIQKLYKEGIREADKKNVLALLSSVATQRADNTFSLKRHLWSEVSVDWPFYSPDERRLFATHCAREAPAVASSGGGRVTPEPTRGSQHHRQQQHQQLQVSHGRTTAAAAKTDVNECGSTTAARKRTASPAPSVNKRGPAAATTTAAAGDVNWLSWSSPAAASSCDASRGRGGGGVTTSGSRCHNQSPSSAGVSDRTPTPDSSPEGHRESVATGAGAVAHSTVSSAAAAQFGQDAGELPAYLSEYTTIQSSAQMLDYKADFDRGYREYQRLWTVMDDVRRKFDCLEKRLRSCPPDTDQRKDIERRIRVEYDACNTADYRARRRRWLYLQNKLHHIKILVRQWQAEHS